MFGLQEQSFESYLEELLAHCEWKQIEWPDNSEFLRLDPPFKVGGIGNRFPKKMTIYPLQDMVSQIKFLYFIDIVMGYF